MRQRIADALRKLADWLDDGMNGVTRADIRALTVRRIPHAGITREMAEQYADTGLLPVASIDSAANAALYRAIEYRITPTLLAVARGTPTSEV